MLEPARCVLGRDEGSRMADSSPKEDDGPGPQRAKRVSCGLGQVRARSDPVASILVRARAREHSAPSLALPLSHRPWQDEARVIHRKGG